jgi:hypothetical protein
LPAAEWGHEREDGRLVRKQEVEVEVEDEGLEVQCSASRYRMGYYHILRDMRK